MRMLNKMIVGILCVLCLTVFVKAEPNDVVSDANFIKAGDGFTAGFSLRGSAGIDEGKELVDIGYIYGVSQFYFAGDVSKQNYFELGAEFESRDIAAEKSVYGLSTLLLMFTPESYQVTGVAGFGYAFPNEEDNHGLTIGGINIRPNEDKNFCITGRLVTPIDTDEDAELRIGFRIKF